MILLKCSLFCRLTAAEANETRAIVDAGTAELAAVRDVAKGDGRATLRGRPPAPMLLVVSTRNDDVFKYTDKGIPNG